jgi:hypothetical protein
MNLLGFDFDHVWNALQHDDQSNTETYQSAHTYTTNTRKQQDQTTYTLATPTPTRAAFIRNGASDFTRQFTVADLAFLGVLQEQTHTTEVNRLLLHTALPTRFSIITCLHSNMASSNTSTGATENDTTGATGYKSKWTSNGRAGNTTENAASNSSNTQTTSSHLNQERQRHRETAREREREKEINQLRCAMDGLLSVVGTYLLFTFVAAHELGDIFSR